jgi:Transglycosylase SLT domain
LPLVACLTATLLSCYYAESPGSRVHMPTPPSRMEFYPSYNDALFQERAGPKEPSADRFGDEPVVQQAAVIYSDNPAPLEKLVPDKPGNTPKKSDDRQSGKRTKVLIEPSAELAYAAPESAPQEQKSSGGWLASLFRRDSYDDLPKISGIDMTKPGYQEVYKAAKEEGVPLNLALRVAKQESGGNCNATSGAGAGGVMQVMPKTAAKHGVTGFKSIYDCRVGARTGVRELKHLLELADGDIKQTLIGYNCGERCMNGKRRKLPVETVNYVDIIAGN